LAAAKDPLWGEPEVSLSIYINFQFF
jgi:hypothetical protein